jgi:hypothetical protein
LGFTGDVEVVESWLSPDAGRAVAGSELGVTSSCNVVGCTVESEVEVDGTGAGFLPGERGTTVCVLVRWVVNSSASR